MTPTLVQFAAATGSTLENALKYYGAALTTFERFNICTPEEIAAFCATVGVETTRLTQMEEGLYYTNAERLVAIFPRAFKSADEALPYCRNPKGLSTKLYGGFHGRGGTMLTWQNNYHLHGERLGVDYVHTPELLLEPLHALLSAGSFWDLHQLNERAHSMDQVTLVVNGPKRLALAERIALRNAGMEALA